MDILDKIDLAKCRLQAQNMMSNNPNFYHTIYHVENMIDEYEKRKDEFGLSEFQEQNLMSAVYLHDCIYIPYDLNNKNKCAEFASNKDVKRLIMSTAIDFDYEYKNLDEQVLHTLDWSRFTDFDRFNESHRQIINETKAWDKKFNMQKIHDYLLNHYNMILISMKNGFKIDFFNDENNHKAFEILKEVTKIDI